MAKYWIGFLGCFFSVWTVSCGQPSPKKQEKVETTSTPQDNAKSDLKLTFQVLEEKYLGKTQSRSSLTFKNTGNAPLLANGWTIYFNGSPSYKAKDTNGPIKIESINGDLLRLTPTENFKAIASGDSVSVELVSAGQIINDSRAPYGFYLVWDKEPAKGHAINTQYVKPTKNAVGWIEAQDIYRQNQVIQDIAEDKLTKVFPAPVQYTKTGTSIVLTPATGITADQGFANEQQHLEAFLENVFGKQDAAGAGATTIQLKKKAGLGAEGYELQVQPKSIVISATSPAGLFYGIQSLKTLMPPLALAKKQTSVTIDGVQVKDAPRFPHRAFMMDVARNFQPKDQVLKVLDLMALYKLNVLHFHLNDDEGWRLEIAGLSELTQVGGRRGHTLDNLQFLQSAYASGPDVNNTTGSGHYTKADFIEILKYAKARHIKVIPEIETPGHARAAIKAMDARYYRLLKEGKKTEAEQYLLRDLNDKSVYRSVQYWNDNVMDVSMPSTYQFLEKVTDEVLAMYKEAGAPIQTIHFGGDEVPKGVWEKSPSVHALMKKDASIKEIDDLWYYFFNKLNAMVKARKLYLSGWEEVGLRKVRDNGKLTYVANPVLAKENVHVDVWNNIGSNSDLAYRMANAGYKVVLTNVTNLYLDLAYQKAYEEPGLYWGGFVDLDKPFYFIPLDYMKNMKVDESNNPIKPGTFAGKEQLTAKGKANIVGLQAPLWSERILSPERQEYMLLPKLLGLAERAWAPDPTWATEPNPAKSEALYNTAWSQFVNILGKRELSRLNYYHNGFQYRIPTAGALVENGKVVANVQLPGMVIRYTVDGSEPTVQSKVYSGSIAEKGTVKLKVFDVTGRGSRVTVVENK
ncbi:family 20 glycosylhydrolase [Nibribacter ruber]|uniref:beta-N-acetylhexosaminidase n=1 Tax=Nibribacter ruber TaxID=2698458 RepID=A0A6P1NZH4_9BACT|nr:family 20 glycosylhydrolase [Nibribacter ruber]QHL87555.1 family 20 glycosylhydrolase [Nibribacter ruber]